MWPLTSNLLGSPSPSCHAEAVRRREFQRRRLTSGTSRIGRRKNSQARGDVWLKFADEQRSGLVSCEQIVCLYYLPMSLAEIEKAVDRLLPDDLAKRADYIARHDKLAWDEEIERDFSPGGKHAAVLEKIDAEIDEGNFTPLP